MSEFSVRGREGKFTRRAREQRAAGRVCAAICMKAPSSTVSFVGIHKGESTKSELSDGKATGNVTFSVNRRLCVRNV